MARYSTASNVCGLWENVKTSSERWSAMATVEYCLKKKNNVGNVTKLIRVFHLYLYASVFKGDGICSVGFGAKRPLYFFYLNMIHVVDFLYPSLLLPSIISLLSIALFLILPSLIIPNGIHAKSWLRNPHPRNPRQEFILPPINLQPSLLVVRNGHPLVGPIARCHGIAVSAARGRRVQADLALNDSFIRQLESSDVAGEIETVGTRRRKEILARV